MAKYKLQEKRKKETVCQYCGGKFKGLLIKKCSLCGQKKDCGPIKILNNI